jgi:hypothetical protein
MTPPCSRGDEVTFWIYLRETMISITNMIILTTNSISLINRVLLMLTSPHLGCEPRIRRRTGPWSSSFWKKNMFY